MEVTPPAPNTHKTQDAEQLLTFFVASEEYGVDILRVQEIRGWTAPMPVPNSPSYIEGVINIRGDIVPIADLRERLGLPRLAAGPTTAVMVLRVEQNGRQRVMGIVVDAMSDVTNIPHESIKPAPDFGNGGNNLLTKGIATVADKMITILNVDEIFATAAALEAA
jgi:purine-binding chemotaxis protein CheW